VDLSSLASRAETRHAEARRHLYATFERYRLSDYGSAEGACAHCLTKDEFDDIAQAPREELTLEQTWSYASSVWPGRSDFKYFLPRLLELVQPLDERIGWDTIERKLPAEGWAACSEAERAAVARYLAARDEHARTALAAAADDVAELLKPMIVVARLAEGLPLAGAGWDELTEHRARALSSHTQAWQGERSRAAVGTLARALSALFSDKQERELESRVRSVVPANDVLLSFVQSGEAERVMLSALESEPDDDLALLVATALSGIALVAPP